MFVIPRGQWRQLDDWGKQLGLRGSGSHSIAIENARIPDYFALPGTHMSLATVTEGTPMSAVLAEGVVQLAVSPWGQVEVDGKPMGTSPPLTRLTLASGNHTITVRNTDFPAYTTTVTVDGESPVTLRHRFGP